MCQPRNIANLEICIFLHLVLQKAVIKTDWKKSIQPLLRKYKNKAHPLQYANDYQLLVMVVLSARSSDAYINQISAPLFTEYPDFKSIIAKPDGLYPLIKGVPGGRKKAEWLINTAGLLMNAKILAACRN